MSLGSSLQRSFSTTSHIDTRSSLHLGLHNTENTTFILYLLAFICYRLAVYLITIPLIKVKRQKAHRGNRLPLRPDWRGPASMIPVSSIAMRPKTCLALTRGMQRPQRPPPDWPIGPPSLPAFAFFRPSSAERPRIYPPLAAIWRQAGPGTSIAYLCGRQDGYARQVSRYLRAPAGTRIDCLTQPSEEKI